MSYVVYNCVIPRAKDIHTKINRLKNRIMSLIIPPNDALRGPTNATTTKSRRRTRNDRTVATAKRASPINLGSFASNGNSGSLSTSLDVSTKLLPTSL